MKISHLHLAFKNYADAVQFFIQVMKLDPIEESPQATIFRMDGFDLAIHPEWGDGDTAMTLALRSEDVERDFHWLVKNGAKARTAPRKKDASINADVFGPGKVVIELEQLLS